MDLKRCRNGPKDFRAAIKYQKEIGLLPREACPAREEELLSEFASAGVASLSPVALSGGLLTKCLAGDPSIRRRRQTAAPIQR